MQRNCQDDEMRNRAGYSDLLMVFEEINFLYEQVEFLFEFVEGQKLYLQYNQKQLQELEQELSKTNQDLSYALCLDGSSPLGNFPVEQIGHPTLEETKKLAIQILRTEKSTCESLADLITAIYRSRVKAEDLQQMLLNT